MSLRVLLLFAFLPLPWTLFAQSMDLETVRNRFEEEVGKLDARLAERTEELRRNYLAALLRAEAAARAESDLDGVVAAQQEISRVDEEGARLRTDREPEHAELRRLQGVVMGQLDGFELTRARDLLNMKENIQRFAANQSMDFTQRGDIDRALAWRNWSEGLDQREDVRRAQELIERREARRTRLAEAARAERHPAFQGDPLELIREQSEEWSDRPRAFLLGNEPEGSERRVIESTPTASGAGHALLQGRLRLVDEEDTLGRYSNRWSRFRHRAHVYAPRLQLTPLPGQSLGETLVVFDLYKRGSGSTREVIRTDRAVLPPIEAGTQVLVESGVYAYESQSYRSSFGHRSDQTSADEFHGFIVTLFDTEGKILYQRSSERGLNTHARTEPPEPLPPPPAHHHHHHHHVGPEGQGLPPGVRIRREGDQIIIERE